MDPIRTMKKAQNRIINADRKLIFTLLLLPLLFVPLTILTLAIKPSRSLNSTIAKPPNPPRLAYLISGSTGDGGRIKRLLKAAYHPLNLYLLHLDLASGPEERADLASYVGSDSVFEKYANVRVLERGDTVTNKGPTAIAMVLHAVAVLLKEGKEWSWFINLSPSDYPLMSQDDLLHIFSYLPRDLNFIEHTSNMGWKEVARGRPIIVDPGLYGRTPNVFWAKEKRTLPSSFKLFVGSPSLVLARPFLEYCIFGWDNLPRTLLMYFTNALAPAESYFQTVICNSQEFQNTTVNHALRFMLWDNPPRQLPVNLTSQHFDIMVDSGSPFAYTIAADDPVIDRIDSEILKRPKDGITPGGWCLRSSSSSEDPRVHEQLNLLRPTERSKSLEKLLVKLLDGENFRAKQCT